MATPYQFIRNGQLFIVPVGPSISEVPYPTYTITKPKDFSILVRGELEEPEFQLDRARMPISVYQDVRDDLVKFSPVPVSRSAFRKSRHAYVGVIDSKGTPYYFALDSNGISVREVQANDESVWKTFDLLSDEEREMAIQQRRENSVDEMRQVDRELSEPLLIVMKSEERIGPHGFLTHKEDGTPIKKPSLYQKLRGLVGKPRTDITETGDDAPKLPKMKLLTKGPLLVIKSDESVRVGHQYAIEMALASRDIAMQEGDVEAVERENEELEHLGYVDKSGGFLWHLISHKNPRPKKEPGAKRGSGAGRQPRAKKEPREKKPHELKFRTSESGKQHRATAPHGSYKIKAKGGQHELSYQQHLHDRVTLGHFRSAQDAAAHAHAHHKSTQSGSPSSHAAAAPPAASKPAEAKHTAATPAASKPTEAKHTEAPKPASKPEAKHTAASNPTAAAAAPLPRRPLHDRLKTPGYLPGVHTTTHPSRKQPSSTMKALLVIKALPKKGHATAAQASFLAHQASDRAYSFRHAHGPSYDHSHEHAYAAHQIAARAFTAIGKHAHAQEHQEHGEWHRKLANQRRKNFQTDLKATGYHDGTVAKALPKKPKDDKVKKTPSSGASKKQAGAGGKTRYTYPNEKGGGAKPGKTGAAQPILVIPHDDSKHANPAEFANQLGVSVRTLQRAAKTLGREAFSKFMRSHLKRFSAKHGIDTPYWGTLYARLQATPGSSDDD